MRPRRAAILITATAVLWLALSACTAFAGSYTVSTCSPSTSSGIWTETNTDASALTAGALCGGPAIGPVSGGNQGALYAEDLLDSSADIPNGAEAGWTFTAPQSTTITAISYYRDLAAYGEPNLVSGLFQADGTTLEQCMIGLAFDSSVVCSLPNTQAPVAFTGLDTSGLFFGILCHVVVEGTSGCSGGGAPQHNAQADLYSAQVTLAESALPTFGELGGALWDGGVVSGLAPVTFSASDPSGIQQDLVRSDTGATLSSATQACNFTVAVPCPQLPTGSMSVDTTRVADGPHAFTVTVTDAAGNSQSVTSPELIIDNGGPPAPTEFTATAQSSTSNAINLAWRNPTNPPQPVTGAMAQLCQAVCAAAEPITPSGAAQITAPGAGVYTLKLWLLDSHGRGGPGNAALESVTVPRGANSTPAGDHIPGTKPAASAHTKLSASVRGRDLRVSGNLAALAKGTVKVSWRSRDRTHTLGAGSRNVKIHNHAISVTFTLSHAARTGTVHVVVRSKRHILVSARARN
jgi:hypothetical protein